MPREEKKEYRFDLKYHLWKKYVKKTSSHYTQIPELHLTSRRKIYDSFKDKEKNNLIFLSMQLFSSDLGLYLNTPTTQTKTHTSAAFVTMR